MTITELKELYDKSKTLITKEESLKAVEKDGNSLQYVKEQDKDICLKAVEQDGYSLQYVKEHIFKGMYKELTVSQIESELGYKIKIIK